MAPDNVPWEPTTALAVLLTLLVLVPLALLVVHLVRARASDTLGTDLQRAYDAMTPAQKREQRISWLYGTMRLSGRTMTREQAAQAVDQYDREHP